MITQGYLARHFQGRGGMRDPALLDVAQDYALKYLDDQGAFELGARVEISPRKLWLPTEPTTPVALAVHTGYEFTPPAIPAPALEESLAEKLAAWRRRHKLRDLYDLDLFGQGALDEPQIRRLLVLKVWHDVVDDGLGQRPFDPSEIVADVDTKSLPPEDIGLLTRPVEPETWLSNVRARYTFLTALDDAEQRVARCSPGDRYEVSQLVLALTSDG
jgi:predicted nucleotidyltransferase component of viral defense system